MAENFVRAAALDQVERLGCLVVELEGEAVALFAHGGQVYGVARRCPHMGFPLERGTVKDGVLTCHWHHARFDISSGGTFDLWADDVPAYPTVVRDGEVWVDLTPRGDRRRHQHERLRDGLEQQIPLVVAKAVIHLLAAGEEPAEPFRTGLHFGTRYVASGWSPGLTILTALMNLLPSLDDADRPLALYHGLAAVGYYAEGEPPRFPVRPLPAATAGVERLKRWFREYVEVRDAEGAERCVISALKGGASMRQMADMLFAAATDHRYISQGHPLDFTNKAFEALDVAGWEYAEDALTSLIRTYATADRMEEAIEWRHPIDLVDIAEAAFEELPAALAEGAPRRGGWTGEPGLVEAVLGDDPRASAAGLLAGLRAGASPQELAAAVAYAAALRIARFHTSNEFPDWDTALHSFTFANAVHAGLCRVDSPELVRGVFDAALTVYLDRFLNIPPAPLPAGRPDAGSPDSLLAELAHLLDERQRVNRAAEMAADYLAAGGDPDRLVAALGRLLLREDRDFHTIQAVEGCLRQFSLRRGTPQGAHVIVAAARYLAAHAATSRAQGQTYQIAARLFRGERIHEGETAGDG